MPPSARVAGVPVLDNESACHGSPQPPPRGSSAPAQQSRQRHTRPIWDHFGTTRYARWRTTCASVNAMPREKLPRETADQRERVTAIYWGSSGRRFKSCQPDTGQRQFSALTTAGFWPVDHFADHRRFRHSWGSRHEQPAAGLDLLVVQDDGELRRMGGSAAVSLVSDSQIESWHRATRAGDLAEKAAGAVRADRSLAVHQLSGLWGPQSGPVFLTAS
jgi:hypothetical protein